MLVSASPFGHVLVDDHHIPRYWATVWAMFHGPRLAASTLKRKLGHIEALYAHVDQLGGSLDDALHSLDFVTLGNVLEAFFAQLRNVSTPTESAQARWNTSFHFVRDICERLERDPTVGNKMESVRARMAQLDRLYLGLRPFRRRLGAKLRALPRNVVAALLDAAMPGSDANPFEKVETQWRVYAVVCLLLYQGLRRGECLLLPANFLKSEVDARTGNLRWYMSVQSNETEDDPRGTHPSIKTASSVRTIPVARETAQALLAYGENYRGIAEHGFYLSSARGAPLSLEGVNLALRRLTEALPVAIRAELFDRTGAHMVTPHALRHTCAVVRTGQLLKSGKTPEQTMMHLRSFFGWSRKSLMPLHYAKAALDDSLNDSWNDEFDARLSVLRNLPQ
ncbi:site-specific integrase [Paraburkholderia caledonica]|uniref:site-specific integrase n=1 Tax=Paraburkholderia caledonica TaxID=134536 RepID=UPI0038B7428A